MTRSVEANRDPISKSTTMMLDAAVKWIGWLEDYPGWKEWNRERFSRTLYDDNLVPDADEAEQRVFVFSEDVERQHAVVFQYLSLQQTSTALRECEYYFRRFPFHGLPVAHSDHITNICEMYFGRFYEFRERLKKYLNVVAVAAPTRRIDVGGFIKVFDKEFDGELRARNSVHHHSRFEDAAIERVFLTHVVSTGPSGNGWKAERQAAYRKVTQEWVARVRKRASKLEEFMEAAAQLTLNSCDFLSVSLAPSDTNS
ncbi:hypothetical protein CD58_05320 [Pseudomonas brassicacearum]|uniref:hypothetical protein n=1 Tax=Pseudomonas brassicacearum TaxID=930166 RepID=UPI00042EAF23|nr:hypothetical protein [Pseudomonas brassicacearum]AHL32344.1 hypothetical protein CD58_05320 [Pseudomonas brassicacearum]